MGRQPRLAYWQKSTTRPLRGSCEAESESPVYSTGKRGKKKKKKGNTALQSLGGRLGGRRGKIFPTASPTAAAPCPPPHTKTTALDASAGTRPSPAANPTVSSPSQRPSNPPIPSSAPPVPITSTGSPPENSLLQKGLGSAQHSVLQSPFRNHLPPASFRADSFQRPLRHLSAGRLWNPTNSTPRTLAPPAATRRRRRPSTPPPPPVPLARPAPDVTIDPADSIGAAAGDYPLLTLHEQVPGRPSVSNRASLQFERNAGVEQRIGLPPSLRHSYDEKRVSPAPSPVDETEAGPSRQPATHLLVPESRRFRSRSRGQSLTKLQVPFGLSFGHGPKQKVDKGKGKEGMAPPENAGDDFPPDLERGLDGPNNRHSTASGISGIGSAISSDSSIMGDPDEPADHGEEWGPQHPCFPHLNPHVPVDSPEYTTTRIIRVRRDWLLEGDLAPTFSNLYPDILDPAGVSEQEFRRIIDKLNSELVPIFSPYDWRNILDGVLGVATGWLWDDFGFTAVKSRLRNLDKWIEQWNAQMEKTVGAEEGAVPPKIVPLKRTGYMTLDIQIPDPEIAPASPTTPSASRDGPPLPSEPPAATTIH
ncbi:hypothetical protein MMYC01_200301 [Madurella mycetomatis]|uniref:Ras modification protein ERF4 n=1 Tax=Madurella mycetomatis TaxID=100816 RepID=A0A175WJN8_9PEZI|nr:hypothetical protein MMYC01_200301 [Madurella mycetomatis]